jgi:hypothetical protein
LPAKPTPRNVNLGSGRFYVQQKAGHPRSNRRIGILHGHCQHPVPAERRQAYGDIRDCFIDRQMYCAINDLKEIMKC